MVAVLFLLLVTAVLADISGTSASAPAFGYDFKAYYDAANRLLLTGSPYQAQTLGGPFPAGPQGLYLYSPLPAILILPFTLLDFHDAATVYVGIQLIALLAICFLMPVRWPLRFAVLSIAIASLPVARDLNLGNMSLLMTLLGVIAWRYVDRPAGSAAIALAVSVRPTMALLAGWLLLRGRWRAVAWVVLAMGIVFLLTLPFVGLRGWVEYLTVLRNLTGFEDVYRNFALNALAVRKGLPDPWPALALFSGYAVAGAAVLLSLRRDRDLSFVVTFGATLLVSPLLWDHYLTNLLVPAAFLADRGRRFWWAIALPLLCFLPPDQLPFIALLGMLLPFLAPNRGEPAGSLLANWPFRARCGAGVTAPEPGSAPTPP